MPNPSSRNSPTLSSNKSDSLTPLNNFHQVEFMSISLHIKSLSVLFVLFPFCVMWLLASGLCKHLAWCLQALLAHQQVDVVSLSNWWRTDTRRTVLMIRSFTNSVACTLNQTSMRSCLNLRIICTTPRKVLWWLNDVAESFIVQALSPERKQSIFQLKVWAQIHWTLTFIDVGKNDAVRLISASFKLLIVAENSPLLQ